MCRSNRSPWAYVLPCVQDECWDIRRGKLLWLSPCLWWRRIPHEDLDEGDHVHEDHDHPWSASGSEDCLVMFSPFHCTIYLYSGRYSVFTVSLPPFSVELHDLVLVSAVSPFCWRSDVNPLFICFSVKFFPVGLRVSLFLHAHLALLVL